MGLFDGDALGGLVGGIGGVVGGLFQNQANREVIGGQQAFQERMANTSHQREVNDLRLAGLNPILSANAGAPGGAGASMPMGDVIGQGLQSAKETALASAQIKNVNSDADLKEMQGQNLDRQTELTEQKQAQQEQINEQEKLETTAKTVETLNRVEAAKAALPYIKADQWIDRASKVGGTISDVLGGTLGKALGGFRGGTTAPKTKWPNADEMRENNRQDMLKKANDLFK